MRNESCQIGSSETCRRKTLGLSVPLSSLDIAPAGNSFDGDAGVHIAKVGFHLEGEVTIIVDVRFVVLISLLLLP
jgi:hypothetical protein